mmetsp:Transcript_17067/g.19067  ORF Transcript_17067/g.19067 Transcript_17067/m.19067 type:complete len:101 (+) Transcript_17067:333-635(+)
MSGKEASEQEITDLIKTFKISVKYIDNLLSKNTYLLGPEISIADLSAFSELMDARAIPELDFSKYPNITNWMERLLDFKEIKRCHSSVDSEGIKDLKAKM